METLSDKITECSEGVPLLEIEDVKDFIKQLKERLPELNGDGGEDDVFWIHEEIDKLAGPKLIKEQKE